jgi:hypothetical protein
MNRATIEQLLRQAPRPAAPAGLLKKLEAAIHLPRVEASAANRHDWRPLLRRWLPAVSFAAFFLACLVAIAVQSSRLSELRQQNRQLREASQSLESLREQNAEFQRLSAVKAELEQLGKDHQELLRLNSEVVQLREQVQELAALQAENQHLQAARQAGATSVAAATQEEEDPFGAEKSKAESIACVNNLKQIGLAARIWARDHNDLLASDFLAMTNELSTPRPLICPSDKQRAEFTTLNWAQFAPSAISYEMLSPGAEETYPQVVYARCPIHGHVCLVDGSVWRSAKIIQKEGKWVMSE